MTGQPAADVGRARGTPEHGQFFVAAEVSRRGYIATLTPRNTRGVDMLVACADASKSVGIQVRANQG